MWLFFGEGRKESSETPNKCSSGEWDQKGKPRVWNPQTAVPQGNTFVTTLNISALELFCVFLVFYVFNYNFLDFFFSFSFFLSPFFFFFFSWRRNSPQLIWPEQQSVQRSSANTTPLPFPAGFQGLLLSSSSPSSFPPSPHPAPTRAALHAGRLKPSIIAEKSGMEGQGCLLSAFDSHAV